MTQEETDEIITVILPTINGGSKFAAVAKWCKYA